MASHWAGDAIEVLQPVSDMTLKVPRMDNPKFALFQQVFGGTRSGQIYGVIHAPNRSRHHSFRYLVAFDNGTEG